MLQFGAMTLSVVMVSGLIRRALAFRSSPASSIGSRQRLLQQNSGTMAAPLATLFSTLPDDETTSTANIDEHDLNGSEPVPDHRYRELLNSVGLDGLSGVAELPNPRVVTDNDLFCNRELKMAGITAIGFDMDYTLAQYKQPAFDQLAFNGAKVKLVESLGYPPEVLNFTYDHTLWARGLIIDTQRGNFLKIDRHKFVRVAYHGVEPMSSETRKFLYARSFNKVMSFTEKYFVNVDTLFQFVDAQLFALLVELKDNGDAEMMDFKTYQEMYKDVRECVDLCHRDGVIKDEVHRNPEEYIIYDKGMVPMLERFQQQGIKTFLLTNSLWEYTSTAMNYLYYGKRVPDDVQKKDEWLRLFDLVVVGSCKPAFMLDRYLNLFRVNPIDGSLKNTDGTYEISALGSAEKFLNISKTFQGGNWLHLHAMLDVEVGEEILYVGDHLYSDVLRSKRTLGWRSAFVMPELPEEMNVFHANREATKQISALRQLRDELGAYIDRMRLEGDASKANQIRKLEKESLAIKGRLQEMAGEWHATFHPRWGALFNAGYQDSRLAFYVNNYACLYTAKASNFGLATKSRTFRTATERLPHDKFLLNSDFDDTSNPWST